MEKDWKKASQKAIKHEVKYNKKISKFENLTQLII